MKNMGKTKRILAAVLALMLLVSTVSYDMPVYASETANDVSGNDISIDDVSGNDTSDDEVSGNDVSDNDVSGNDISGNDISDNDVSDNDVSDNDVSGNDISDNNISGNSIMLLDLDDEGTLKVPDGDETYIKSVAVTSVITGTQPFDGDNEAGNDKDNTNDIIRSFDDLAYNFKISVESYQDEDGEKPNFDQDVLCIEAYLPHTSKEAVFDLGAMTFLESPEVTTDDNGYQTLKAKYTMTKSANSPVAVPGSTNMQLAIKVRGAENGSKIKPEVKFWMENNDTSAEGCEEHESVEVKSLTLQEVTVSAALKLNVKLQAAHEGNTSAHREFDFNTGNDAALNKGLGTIDGQSFCYGVTLQLCEPDSSKGMRGMALPKGDISFDFNISSSYKVSDESSVNNGNTYEADSTELENYQPLVYSVEGNKTGNTQQDGRDVTLIGSSPYAAQAAPANKLGVGSGTTETACEDGGTWSVRDNGNGSITLTVSGYDIPLNSFPQRQLGSNKGINYYYTYSEGMDIADISQACFSAGEIWIVQPYKDGNTKLSEVLGSGAFTIQASTEGNITLTVDGVGVNYSQENTGDDVANATAIQGSGEKTSMSNRIRYAKKYAEPGTFNSDIFGGVDCINNGKDYAYVGQDDGIGITSGIVYGFKNEEKNRIAAVNVMAKFDSEAIELTGPVEVMDSFFADGTKYYYGYLDNEANWESDDAMQEATEQMLNWDTEFVEGRNYVAVLGEKRKLWNKFSGNLYSNFFSQIRIKDEASLAGNVYMICQVGRIWTSGQLEAAGIELTESAIDAYIPSVAREDFATSEYPATHLVAQLSYDKARYDANGNYLGGHTAQSQRGDSLYIYAYATQIDKNIALLQSVDGSAEAKTSYNLDRDERIVDYVLSPSFKGIGSSEVSDEGNETTVTVVDTLPSGLEYSSGSAYIGGTYSQSVTGQPGTVTGGQQTDPVIGTDKNGNTTLTWKLTCKAGAELPKIYYSCTIGEDVTLQNGDQLTNSVTIAAENEAGRAASAAAGNLDTTTIKVITLGASGFFMTVEKKLVEINENIKYYAAYSNNGSSNMAFTLVNAMPYNGNNSSSFAGSYDVDNWKLDTSKISGSASDYKLYYTTDTKYVGVTLGTADTDNTVSADTIKNSWTEIAISSSGTAQFPDNTQPVAWALMGTLAGGKSAQVEYIIEQTNPKVGDKLVSKGSEGDFVRSVSAKRANRIVSGYAWMDSNQDGQKDDDEALMVGLKVTLQMKDGTTGKWVQAYSLLDPDEPCIAYTTANGYSFGTLPEGKYRVLFEDGINTVKLSACGVTTAGTAADQKKSIASAQTSGGTLTAAVVGTISLPALSEINSTLVYEAQWQNAGFTRTVEYEPKVTKELAGDDAPTLGEGDFSFELTSDGADEAADTKSNGAADSSNKAEVVFDKIQLTDVGTYVYKIKEEIPASKNPSITYDDKEMTLTVVVGADNNGALKISSATYTNNATFTNEYTKPTPVEKAFEVSKATAPGTGTTAADVPTSINGLFTFTLTPEDNAPMPVVNGKEVTKQEVQNSDSSVKFDKINFTEVGTYKYEITENAPGDVSWSKDSRTIKVTVTVTLNSDNTLSAVVTYTDEDNDTANNTVFTNVYTLPEKTTANFSVNKSLTGDRSTVTEGEYSFTLTAKTTGAPMPASAEGNSMTASCSADGSADFGEITYTEDPVVSGTNDELVYVYEISENKGSNHSVTYDDKKVTVTVTVSKDENNNKLQRTVTYSKNGSDVNSASFVNTYEAPAEAKYVLEAKKELEGPATLKAGQFEFTLTPLNAAPMPAKADLEALTDISFEEDDSGKVTSITVKNAGNGSIAFPEISVAEDMENFIGKAVTDADGNSTVTNSYVYTYEIKEVQKSVVGYTYDTKTVTATVTVTKNDNNKLEAAVVYKSSTEDSSEDSSEDSTHSSSLLAKLGSLLNLEAVGNIFKNTYTAPKEAEIVLEGKKVLNGKGLKDDEFSFKLEPLDGAPGEEQTVKNTADGSITFEKITVAEIQDVLDFGDGSESKKFSYKITEVNERKTGYTYDASVYVATVEIKKNQNNELEVVGITYEKDEEAADSIEFVNTFTAPSSSSDDDSSTVIVIRDGKAVPVPAADVKSPKTADAVPFAGFTFLLPAAAALVLAGKKKDEE